MQDIYEKNRCNIIFNDAKPKAFPIRSGTTYKDICCHHIILWLGLQILDRQLDLKKERKGKEWGGKEKKKERKDTQIRKK